jgi:Mn2+/Fe2+ NRAMP family transporter
MKTYRLISYAAFAVAVALIVAALMLLTGSYARMQNVAVVLLIGFGICATVGMFFAAKADGIDGHGHQRQVPPDAHASK